MSNPTRVRGDGYNGLCTSPQVKLTGVERVSRVFNLQSSNNAEVTCLEITDNSNCVLSHTGGLACKRDIYPYGSYADDGIYASDSKNIRLSKINIHGLAHYGVYAGRLTDWAVENVTIRANGWAGWNGDFGKDASGNQIFSGNSGNLTFTNFLVEYNGCGEMPLSGDPVGCWAQEAGGYGDGFGTAATGGDWVFTDSTFRYNTSDGLDLLYHTLGGKVTIDRVRTTGNAGNQIKIAGNSSITNGVIHGNCGYFNGKLFTYFVDDCRAAGDTLALVAVTSSDLITVTNSTMVGEGNTITTAKGPLGSILRLRNNILVGLPYFLDPSYRTADTFVQVPQGGAPNDRISVDESRAVKQTLRSSWNCTTPAVICTSTNNVLRSATSAKLDPHLKAGSPARDSALNHASEPLVPTIDYYKNERGLDGFYDRGASEDESTTVSATKN